MTFSKVIDDYATVEKNPNSGADWVYEAGLALPQTEARAEAVSMADPMVRHQFAAGSWTSGVQDAARELRDLITIHDNGGTASSPKKIKAAARELLLLLGEAD